MKKNIERTLERERERETFSVLDYHLSCIVPLFLSQEILFVFLDYSIVPLKRKSLDFGKIKKIKGHITCNF
jgi:hypothetical protein